MTSEHQGTEANLLACFGGVWNGRKGLSATRQGVAARVLVGGVLRRGMGRKESLVSWTGGRWSCWGARKERSGTGWRVHGGLGLAGEEEATVMCRR